MPSATAEEESAAVSKKLLDEELFFEVISLFPLFPGDNELDQINKIHNILGTPSEELLNQFRK